MNSTELIGRARDRWQEIDNKDLDWKSFYNGWLEGRIDLFSPPQLQANQKKIMILSDLIDKLQTLAVFDENDTMLTKVYKSGIVTAINEIEKAKATLDF